VYSGNRVVQQASETGVGCSSMPRRYCIAQQRGRTKVENIENPRLIHGSPW